MSRFNEDAVAAHVALNALAIVAGNVATVREHWPRLDAPHRDRLLASVLDRVSGIEMVIRHLSRGDTAASVAAAADLLACMPHTRDAADVAAPPA